MKTENLYGEKSKCCGCWGCYNVCPKSAITMQQDNEGFLYPSIDENVCIDCKMCLKVCPIKTAVKRKEELCKTKHIGIINLEHTQNYGAVIAASVLEDVVRNIVGKDYIVENFKLDPSYPFKNFIEYKMDRIKSLGGYKLYRKNMKSKVVKTAQDKLRDQRFTVFRDTFLNESVPYHNANHIKESPNNYVAYISGSDIVWAPKKVDTFRGDIHFLKFANDCQRTIAYAPSIDSVVNRKLKKLAPFYRDGLSHIDYISVREKTSVEFIQSLTDKKVYECCDPAFLVEPEYYDDMISTAQIKEDKEPFIYVYILELNQEIVNYANKLAKEKGLKICYYSKFYKDYECNSEDCTADGPAEFLYRLRNAEYVLTNSFHCVVFSLLFRKKFLSFTRSKISIKSTDLLKKFDLLERIITENNKIDIDKDINFDNVDDIILNMREDSLDFLKQSLKGI